MYCRQDGRAGCTALWGSSGGHRVGLKKRCLSTGHKEGCGNVLATAQGFTHISRRAQQNCSRRMRGISHMDPGTPAGRETGLGSPPTCSEAPGGWLGMAVPHFMSHGSHTGWRHPPPEKACPPTFQRFPHSLQTTKVVMGSSELRVCTCGEGDGERGPPPAPGLSHLEQEAPRCRSSLESQRGEATRPLR